MTHSDMIRQENPTEKLPFVTLQNKNIRTNSTIPIAKNAVLWYNCKRMEMP